MENQASISFINSLLRPNSALELQVRSKESTQNYTPTHALLVSKSFKNPDFTVFSLFWGVGWGAVYVSQKSFKLDFSKFKHLGVYKIVAEKFMVTCRRASELRESYSEKISALPPRQRASGADCR